MAQSLAFAGYGDIIRWNRVEKKRVTAIWTSAYMSLNILHKSDIYSYRVFYKQKMIWYNMHLLFPSGCTDILLS